MYQGRFMRRSFLPLVLIALAAPVIEGCRSCKNDHPFVPYRIEAGTSASVVPVVDASRPDAARLDASGDAGFHRETATVAPPHTTRWPLGHLTLDAPAGGTFRQALVWDIDGDGHEDALALVEEADEAIREELFFYRGAADGVAPPVVVSLGDPAQPFALDRRCTRVEHLTRVGKRSASVEVGESCTKDVSDLGPDRLVALVAWSDSLKTRFVLPIVDPPGAQALSVELDGSDVDGDGLDDASLRVTLEGGEPPFEPGPAVHAVFHWFDRPAGMSREPGEPERSFRAIASAAAERAAKSKDAASGLALASAGRFLYEAVCAESPVRRVAPGASASPLLCEAGRALEGIELAQMRAYVTTGDPLRAIAALDEIERGPATHTPARMAEARAWVTSMAPVVQAEQVRAISAVPRLGKEPSWGALRFEPSGSVLVRTLAGVVRVDPVHGDEVDAAGVLAWPTQVASPDGKQRLEGAFAPCRGVALEVSLVAGEGSVVDGGDATSIRVPVATSLGARCASRAAAGVDAREPAPGLPIAWGPKGLQLLVAGEPILVAPGANKASPLVQLIGQPVIPGSPRSPDGVTLAVPTSQGIVVRGAKTRILRAKELDHGYGELRDCTVSDDASRVACVRGGVAFVGVWPAP